MEMYQYYQPGSVLSASGANGNIYYIYNEPTTSNYYPRFAYYNGYNSYQIICNNYPTLTTDTSRRVYYSNYDKCEVITKNQLTQLKAQINAYKLLLKSQPVPDDLLYVSYGSKYDEYKKYSCNNNKDKDTDEISAVNIDSLDYEYLKNIRESLIKDRIDDRINSIESQSEIEGDIKLKIELKSLKLINLQRELRQNILQETKESSQFLNRMNIRSYRKQKIQILKDARYCAKLEALRIYEEQAPAREKYKLYVNAILQHCKDLKEFSKSEFAKLSKINKAIINYFSNNQRNKKKEQERIEKERMRRLMAEDEEGYRKLIDEKKDSRLHFLLSQTDEFIDGLTKLVKQHKKTQIEQKQTTSSILKSKNDMEIIAKILQKKYGLTNMESNKICNGKITNTKISSLFDDIRIDVINRDTKDKLIDENAPLFANIFNWLDANKNWEPYYEDTNEEENDESIDKNWTNTIDVADLNLADDDEYDKNQSYYSLAHCISEKITEQPSQLKNGTMKEYQVLGLEWLVSLYNNNLNGILADEMGLGKTIQTISLITYLMEKKKVNGPYLIIVPLSTISNWSIEFEKWAPHINRILYKGSPNFRKTLQSKLKAGKFNVVLTTYEYIIKDKSVLSKLLWKYIIIDEGHRMKNHHCKLTQILNVHYQTSYRLLLTGTPLQNNLPELWALLNFLLPNIFNSVTTFEQWFNAPFANSVEKVELNQEETLLIIRRLHKVLRPFLLRRLKKEVENQLPDKVEYVIKCEMSALQRTLYIHMQNKGVILTDGSEIDKKGLGSSRTLLNTLMQLRKICNHPFMFPHIEQAIAENNFHNQNKDRRKVFPNQIPSEVFGPDLFRVSGKFELLDRILPKLKAKNHRILLFCQMTSLMTIMAIYFEYRGFKYLRLDGSTKSDDREELLSLFNNPNQDYFIFMLSTRAGGLGLNLQAADTVIIFDSDWNPHLDLQAQDRAHRIGQKNEVRVLRLIMNNSVEEKILAAAKFKLNVDEKVIQAGMFDQKSTGNERRQFLQALLKQDESLEDSNGIGHAEDECPDNETINQMIARNEEEFEFYQKMDMERIVEDERRNYIKSRLMLYDEMPNWILKLDSEMNTEAKHQTETTCNQKRIRKEVDYRDSLTESQLEKHIMSDNDDKDDSGTNRNSSNNISTDVKTLNSSNDAKKNKKKIISNTASTDKAVKSGIGCTPNKKRKLNPSILTDTIAAEDRRRSREFQRLINKLLDYREKDGRIICDPFVKLPTKRELPDYYDIIKKPMDFVRIRQKLKDNKYKDLDELSADIHLLCKNAQVYNIDGSLIFEDSILIQSLWDQIKQEFDQRKPSKTPIKKDKQIKHKKVTIQTAEIENQNQPSTSQVQESNDFVTASNVKSNQENVELQTMEKKLVVMVEYNDQIISK